MGTVLAVLQVLLFVLTVLWAGKKPTVAKIAAMIVCFAAVEVGYIVVGASSQGLDPYEWYRDALLQQLNAMQGTLSADQRAVFEQSASLVAGCWVAIYSIAACVYVICGLLVRWVIERARRVITWPSFSSVDLSVLWVVPLIVGVALYAVSAFPSVPEADRVFLASANIMMLSVIPLFFQGAAAGKGIMNGWGLSFAWQLCLGVAGLVTGLLFLVIPLVGLLDFWVNFRKLPREEACA